MQGGNLINNIKLQSPNLFFIPYLLYMLIGPTGYSKIEIQKLSSLGVEFKQKHIIGIFEVTQNFRFCYICPIIVNTRAIRYSIKHFFIKINFILN